MIEESEIAIISVAAKIIKYDKRFIFYCFVFPTEHEIKINDYYVDQYENGFYSIEQCLSLNEYNNINTGKNKAYTHKIHTTNNIKFNLELISIRLSHKKLDLTINKFKEVCKLILEVL